MAVRFPAYKVAAGLGFVLGGRAFGPDRSTPSNFSMRFES